MDRTLANGTGFTRQYPDEVFQMYENIDTTPDDLLLFFHHVNYATRLKSGNTVIQHIYDAHYNGAEAAQTFVALLSTLRKHIDAQRYEEIMFEQTYQAGDAIFRRDAITTYFHKLSGIPDELGRVGHHPYRTEAEDMTLDGSQVYGLTPWEAASGSYAIVTSTNTTTGTASTTLNVASGTYDIAVSYYYLVSGISHFQLLLNGNKVAEWLGNINDGRLGHDSTIYLDDNSPVRKIIPNVRVREGDTLSIVGIPQGLEPAPIDYISILPRGVSD